MSNSRTNWVNLAALAVLTVATLAGHYWVWGLLFGWWVVQSVLTGTSFVVFPAERSSSRIAFWIITAFWLIIAIWYLVAGLNLPGYP